MSKFFTIGHSNNTIEKFIDLLQTHAVKQLADIRSMPRSRYNPQFNEMALAEALAAANIKYIWLRDLGGKRKSRADSINTGFHPGGFRGYADYMQTPVFAAALDRLIDAGATLITAYMCAEGNPRNCHRLLVSDALTMRGSEVTHILPSGETEQHKPSPLARFEDGTLFYPSEQPLLL